jgi:PEGA domain
MALILAVNPRGGHSATLARLARELRGHDLVGADSCTVAIASLGRQMPDLVLLPPEEEPGQAELLSRLQAVPGGVRTLTLPPIALTDPRALAGLVLASLAAPADASRREAAATARERERASAHLVAAGIALAGWIRARRAVWDERPAKHVPVVEDLPPARAFPQEGARPPARDFPPAKDFAYRPARPAIAPETAEEAEEVEEEEEEQREQPSLAARASALTGDWRGPIVSWLPRAAALVVVVALAVAGFSYWPKLGGPSGTLRVASQPAGARVVVDGKFAGTTPITLDGLTADTHSVVVETPTASIRRTVTIAAGQTTALSEFLGDGWLRVFAPFDVEVSEGTRPLRLDTGGRVTLPPGSHTLRFANRQRGYEEVRSVEIKPTETTTVRLVPRVSQP